MQLSDGEDADEHGLQSGVVEWGGGEPQRAVGDAGALGEKVEDVGALLDGLRAGEKTVTVETYVGADWHHTMNRKWADVSKQFLNAGETEGEFVYFGYNC